MTTAVNDWAAKVRAGNVRAISRAITAIENHSAEAEELLRELFPHTGKAYLTGVTGAPGTGKSTLVDRLAAYHRKREDFCASFSHTLERHISLASPARPEPARVLSSIVSPRITESTKTASA